jgi:hypothetical protein
MSKTPQQKKRPAPPTKETPARAAASSSPDNGSNHDTARAADDIARQQRFADDDRRYERRAELLQTFVPQLAELERIVSIIDSFAKFLDWAKPEELTLLDDLLWKYQGSAQYAKGNRLLELMYEAVTPDQKRQEKEAASA